MANQFWLIQRGNFNNDINAPTSFFGGDSTHLIQGDYMGSAEFEYGAIPAAYVRIMSRYDEYRLYDTGLKTVRGVPLNLFAHREHHSSIITAIKRYLENPYHLKEWSNLEYHFKDISDGDKHRLRTNFWWCIDHNRFAEEDIGDWVLFTGAYDRQKAFLRVIDTDFREWWSALDSETQQKKIKEAWRR